MSVLSESASFGLGFIGAMPTTGGDPVYFGLAQGINITLTETKVPLRGNKKYAVDIGIGECDMKGKIDSVNMFGGSLATLIGGTTAAGMTKLVADETGTVPATPFELTLAEAATYVNTYRVYNVTNSVQMTEVSSSPSAMEYSVASGVITFNTAEEGDSVLTTYSYTDAADGYSTVVTNDNQSVATKCILACCASQTTTGGELYVTFPKVVFGGLTLDIKPGQWNTNNVEFDVCADSAATICTFSSEL